MARVVSSAMPMVALLLVACGGSVSSGVGTGGGGPSQGGSSNGGAIVGGGLGSGGASAGGSAGSLNTIQLAANYDRSCQFDDECTLVSEGDVCGCLYCPNAAVASHALTDWDTDWAGIVCTGPPVPCGRPACPVSLAACTSGICTIRAP